MEEKKQKKRRVVIFRQLLGDFFSEAFINNLRLHQDSETEIKAVEKVEEVEEEVEAVLQKKIVVSVVFPSRRFGLLSEAQAIKKKYPNVRVVILTALLPDEDECEFIPKDLIFVKKQVVPERIERMWEAIFASMEAL